MWVSQLVQSLRIPPLATYGIGAGQMDDIPEKAAKASSMKANPGGTHHRRIEVDSGARDLTPDIRIVEAAAADVPVILELILGLADYEKLSDQVTATEEKLRETLFGSHRGADVLLAYHGGECTGFALFFPNYSTFLARPGNLPRRPVCEAGVAGEGIGTALLRRVAAIARERGLWTPGMGSSRLGTRRPSGSTRSLGAVRWTSGRKYRVTGEAL